MLPERPRARRHPFQAQIELMDLNSETTVLDRTRNLNMFGCRTESTPVAIVIGTKVRVKITYKAAIFSAAGRVVSARRVGGIGVAFTDISEKDQQILEKWMAELRAQERDRGGTSETVIRPMVVKRR
jgi:hypothetical protein